MIGRPGAPVIALSTPAPSLTSTVISFQCWRLVSLHFKTEKAGPDDGDKRPDAEGHPEQEWTTPA
jgi:hypothetical protein